MHDQRPVRRRREAGLSLLEVLVALVIASLVLGAVLPVVSQSLRQNLRLSERSVLADVAALEEMRFRALLAAAIQPPSQFAALPNPDLATGGTQALELHVMARSQTPCVKLGAEATVRLEIERIASGGRLLCRGPEGDVVLASWRDGQARFAYSLDGRAWDESWPMETSRGEDLGAPPDAEMDIFPRLTRAPLVRLEINVRDDQPSNRVWIARAGDLRPIKFGVLDVARDSNGLGAAPAPASIIP